MFKKLLLFFCYLFYLWFIVVYQIVLLNYSSSYLCLSVCRFVIVARPTRQKNAPNELTYIDSQKFKLLSIPCLRQFQFREESCACCSALNFSTAMQSMTVMVVRQKSHALLVYSPPLNYSHSLTRSLLTPGRLIH